MFSSRATSFMFFFLNGFCPSTVDAKRSEMPIYGRYIIYLVRKVRMATPTSYKIRFTYLTFYIARLNVLANFVYVQSLLTHAQNNN